MMKKYIIGTILGFFLNACGSSEPNPDFTDKSETFILQKFFKCPVSGSGVFFNFSDEADRHFNVTFSAEYPSDKVMILNEEFVWSDGEKQKRVWTLQFSDSKNFTGTAGDVIGKAIGKIENNGLHMLYTLEVERKNGDKIHLNMDDRLYLTSEGMIINKAKAKKYGITVGELVAAFSQDKPCH
jgi:hypothetical protein